MNMQILILLQRMEKQGMEFEKELKTRVVGMISSRAFWSTFVFFWYICRCEFLSHFRLQVRVALSLLRGQVQNTLKCFSKSSINPEKCANFSLKSPANTVNLWKGYAKSIKKNISDKISFLGPCFLQR